MQTYSDKFIIEGGKMLSGEIPVYGAKNDIVSLVAASLVFSTPVAFARIPHISDLEKMTQLLEGIGAHTDMSAERVVSIDPRAVSKTVLEQSIAEKIRASVIFIGPVLARLGEITLPFPGGCVIGKRPIDFFIQGFKTLGADVVEKNDLFTFRRKTWNGGDVFLPYPSVTATETMMIGAILAAGTTIIRNAACEPEIENLARFLSAGGAIITGAGTHTIAIEGRNGKLLEYADSSPFTILPDRIETGSFAILGALLGNPIRITNCVPHHIDALLERLTAAGVSIEKGPDWIHIQKPKNLSAVDIKTGPYPALATDLQAPFTILLTQAVGNAVVFETVFEERLRYVEEIKQMGANITVCDPHRAIVVGPTPLEGRSVQSPDLRSGLAFILAGLIAQGESIIHNVYHIDRGYEHIEERLSKLGANIKRITLV